MNHLGRFKCILGHWSVLELINPHAYGDKKNDCCSGTPLSRETWENYAKKMTTIVPSVKLVIFLEKRVESRSGNSTYCTAIFILLEIIVAKD
jgi:hypothetical protein